MRRTGSSPREVKRSRGKLGRLGPGAPRSISVLLVLSFALVLIPSGVADARRPAVCAKKGGEKLVATREARVFNKHSQVYGCLRGKRRAFRLGGKGVR